MAYTGNDLTSHRRRRVGSRLSIYMSRHIWDNMWARVMSQVSDSVWDRAWDGSGRKVTHRVWNRVWFPTKDSIVRME